MRVTGRKCAEAAEAALLRNPPIRYGEEDCQAFIEQTAKRAGGKMKDYRGSNDMFRNACSEIIPLAIARLQPGMVLFIVANDGGEPAQYKADGKGNAGHVGWYTGLKHEVVHSSATRGQVVSSTLKNAWTHAGYLKEVDYGASEPTAELPSIAYVNLPPDKNVFHRISPNRESSWFGRINGGEAVDVVSVSGEWTRVKYGGHDGYVMSSFLTAQTPDNPAQDDLQVPFDDDGMVVLRLPAWAANALYEALRGAL